MQLISLFDKVFKKANLNLNLHPYEILITSSRSGLIEYLQNSASVDQIKKKMTDSNKSLNLFYRQYFKDKFEIAQLNFVKSLAAYSLICYYLQIKDRHNGNIMIDIEGNLIHIDYGFILGISPGNLNFESAPFKLTQEYIDIMDGEDSEMFVLYKSLMVKGMIESKKHVESFVNLIEIMAKGSVMPCFENKNIKDIIYKFRQRFYVDKKEEDFIRIVDDLVCSSKNNFWTRKYDYFQKLTNGIIP